MCIRNTRWVLCHGRCFSNRECAPNKGSGGDSLIRSPRFWSSYWLVHLFCTSNYVALGLFASVLVRNGDLQDRNVLLLVAGMFIVQSILGLIGCVLLRKHFTEIHMRLAKIAKLVAAGGVDGGSAIQIPRSLTLYRRLIAVMILGVASLCIVWIALPFV